MANKKADPVQHHELHSVWLDESAGGYRASCICGHVSDAWTTVRMVGEEIDEHFATKNAKK